MALTLEIRDRRGTTTFHPLTQLPLTLGRGLGNDIILDDPYVDARHARIAPDDAGGWAVHDLGSVNGLLTNGARTGATIPVQPGVELRIGRTTLRFRDQDEPLPPALVDSSQRAPGVAGWVLTPRGGWFVVVTAIVLTALIAWLDNTERSAGTNVFGYVLGAELFVALWAGVWAVAVRGPDRRFQMRAHFAVASAVLVLMMLYSIVNSWLTFFFPDSSLVGLAFTTVVLLGVAGVVVGHLTVAGVQTPRLRWRTGLIVSGALLVLMVFGELLQDEKFSDVPKFPAVLKPIPAALVPTRSVDDFVRAMADARGEADKAVKR